MTLNEPERQKLNRQSVKKRQTNGDGGRESCTQRQSDIERIEKETDR